MRATLLYTLARFGLLAVTTVLMYLAGLRGVLLIALALLASGLASYVLLSRMRDRIASSIDGRISTVRSRLDDGARAEDGD